jgi:hypothetical protein
MIGKRKWYSNPFCRQAKKQFVLIPCNSWQNNLYQPLLCRISATGFRALARHGCSGFLFFYQIYSLPACQVKHCSLEDLTPSDSYRNSNGEGLALV